MHSLLTVSVLNRGMILPLSTASMSLITDESSDFARSTETRTFVSITACIIVVVPDYSFSALYAAISALISSKETSGSLLFLLRSALRASIVRSLSLALSFVPTLIVKGMLRLSITARIKIFMAVLALMPNCSQRLVNSVFTLESVRTVIVACAIISNANLINQ